MGIVDDEYPSCGVNVRTAWQHNAEKILSGKKILVLFHSPYCGACEETIPHFQHASMYLCSDVQCVKVDVTKLSSIATNYNIERLPTLLLLENGVEVKRVSGAHDASEIVELAAD